MHEVGLVVENKLLAERFGTRIGGIHVFSRNVRDLIGPILPERCVVVSTLEQA